VNNIFSIKGLVAIVTGASRGIGATIANGLNEAGADVYGIGRSNVPIMEQEEILYNYEKCDINNTVEFKKFCKNIFNVTGRIDILVNAAGISIIDNERMDYLDYFDNTIKTNLRSAFSCSKIVSDYMFLSESGGSIINITSIAGQIGFPNNPAYVASKGGLQMLTKALAIDYSKKNIRVNNIAPGYIKTSMTEESFKDKKRMENRKNHTILDRWGKPEDLIGAAIFLASKASSYVTGTDLIVDGGWLSKGLVE
jgi:NAD(P)-dependent dehydrogenase (short-subunit alcohol dehydrogenase family)